MMKRIRKMTITAEVELASGHVAIVELPITRVHPNMVARILEVADPPASPADQGVSGADVTLRAVDPSF